MRSTIISVVLIVIAETGCTGSEAAKHQKYPINQSMAFRSVAERRDAEKKALSGDAEAAKRLADSSLYVDHNLAAAERWFAVAASYGDKDAKVSLSTVKKIRKEQNR